MLGRRQLVLSTAAFLPGILAVGSAPARAATRTLRIGYILPVQSQLGAGATAFADEVTKRTGGRITIQRFPDAMLGGDAELLKGVQMGTIDIAFVTGMGMSSVGDIGHSVPRSVRSSTAEVDRRQSRHYAVDLPCRVGIAGRTTQAGRLADPGETGASITDTAPLPIGQRGVLDFDGLGQKLPFIVLEAADGLLGVGFEPDAAAAEVFRGVPKCLGSRLAA
jgi:hypothetical protein